MPFCTIPAGYQPGEAEHRIHFNTHGRGPNKIIFLMGLGGTTCQWEKQVEYFSARGDQFEMLTIENRGMALSDSVGGRWTTNKMARDALYVLDSLHWNKDVHVVGLSMGGMIAQELCEIGPKGRFASLTLLSTIAGGIYSLAYFLYCLPTGVSLVFRANFLAKTGGERLKHTLAILYPSQFLQAQVPHPKDATKLTTNFDLFKRTLIRRAVEEQKQGVPMPSTSSIMKQMIAVASHRVTKENLQAISEKLNGNILIVTGDEDILVHMQNSMKLNEGLRAKKLLVIKGAGHGAFEQCPDEINAEIEKTRLGRLEDLFERSAVRTILYR